MEGAQEASDKRNSDTIRAKKNITSICVDVHTYIFSFLTLRDQSRLRRSCNFFAIIFDHAFQRGHIACVIHDGFVEDYRSFDVYGDPLRVGPVAPHLILSPSDTWGAWLRGMASRSEALDKQATLVINTRMWLQATSDTTKTQSELVGPFLCRAPFKAVHLMETETLIAIGNNFLFLCENLRSFSISTPCPVLTRVGGGWMGSCPRLTKIDVSGCSALRMVGNSWLAECSALRSVKFEGCAALQYVGGRWLKKCTALRIADFSALVSLKDVADSWLDECSSLERLDVAACLALESVGQNWLQKCTSLESVDFSFGTGNNTSSSSSSSSSLRNVGAHWLDRCTLLRRADFSGLHSLKAVGWYWMHGCPVISAADFTGCRALENVGGFWMADCAALETVLGKDSVALKTVGPSWLVKCPSLRQIILSADHSLSPDVLSDVREFLELA